MVETKDKGTGDHCNRLLHICSVFGRTLGLTEEGLFILRQGSILHDIGKLGVPDSILLKQDLLDENEREIMHQHPVIGYELCKGLKSLRASLPIIRHHHERFNGSGYPDGLAGEKIPFLVRVFQIADIYDALANSRLYKGIISVNDIIRIFNEESDKGWRDPELVSVFIDFLHKQPDGFIKGEDMEPDMGRLMFENIIATPVINPECKATSSAGE